MKAMIIPEYVMTLRAKLESIIAPNIRFAVERILDYESNQTMVELKVWDDTLKEHVVFREPEESFPSDELVATLMLRWG